MRRQAPKSGGAAGLFVLLGILTILAVTFAAGTYAGRIWANRPRMVAGPAPAEREPGRRGLDARASKIVEAAPRLTFYHELTAPLTAPPPPPKPAKTSPPPLGAASTGSHRSSTPQAGLAAPATTIPTSGVARFTIQVGAYRLRPPADALRATLAGAGHDARVVETDAPNGVRFRVQIGDFTSRDAAREAAARLTGQTFVTTR